MVSSSPLDFLPACSLAFRTHSMSFCQKRVLLLSIDLVSHMNHIGFVATHHKSSHYLLRGKHGSSYYVAIKMILTSVSSRGLQAQPPPQNLRFNILLPIRLSGRAPHPSKTCGPTGGGMKAREPRACNTRATVFGRWSRLGRRASATVGQLKRPCHVFDTV